MKCLIFLLTLVSLCNSYGDYTEEDSGELLPCFNPDTRFYPDNQTKNFIREDYRIAGNELREGTNCYGAGAIPPRYPYIAFEGLPATFYPVCRESYAKNIDPYLYGVEFFREGICPDGVLDESLFSGFSYDEDSFFVGLNAEYNELNVPYRATSRLNEQGFSLRCDMFHPKTRLAGSLFLLKQMSSNHALYFDHHEDWKPYTYNLIEESGGVERECDDGFNINATHYAWQITLWENFFYYSDVRYNTGTLAHEGQHEIESHIGCERSDRGSQCDTGYEMYNSSFLDIGEDDTNAFTISHWVQEDLMKSFSLDEDNQRKIQRFYYNYSLDNPLQCRIEPLLTETLRHNAFYYLADDHLGFNIPKPIYPYTTFSEFKEDYDAPWNCQLYLCDPAEYRFFPGAEGVRSCNELLNPENIAINQANQYACDPSRPIAVDYRNRIRDAEEEGHQEIYDNYFRTITLEKRACAPITQEHLNNYCDQRIALVDNVYALDQYGYLAQYGQSDADFCVRRYCESDKAKDGIWGNPHGGRFTGEYLYQWWMEHGQYMYGIQNEDDWLRMIITFADEGKSCLDYFCGEDLKCMLRYIRYEGDTNLANRDLNQCTENYLTCIESSGEEFNLEEYPEHIAPRERESSNEEEVGFGGLNIGSLERLRWFACHEAYEMCKIREIGWKGKILANLYRERRENFEIIRRAIGEEKINPYDHRAHVIRKPSKQYFTNELLYQINRLNQAPTSFEHVTYFNHWFSMPENISNFAHFMPEVFLTFYDADYAAYIAGPWIKKFSPVEIKALKNFSSETEKLINQYEAMKNYSGNEILNLMLKASKKLSEKEYVNLYNSLKSAKNYAQKIKILNSITK